MMILKRGLDLIISLIGLIALFPLMLVIGLAIKLDSSGPVIFKQRRLGKDGKPFTLLKFRTMVDGAENMGTGLLTAKNDPRITRVGRLLRRTSLDELPQLANVLLGQMSLVGPRPAPLHHLERYQGEEKKRLLMRPGITGWAQVNGRNELTWEERIKLDVEYVENWSLWLDFRILLMTLAAVVSSRGVYSGRYEQLVKSTSQTCTKEQEGVNHARR